MKILIVSQYFWPENFRINELVTSLHEEKIEVEVLTGKPNYPEGVIYSGYKLWNYKIEKFNEVPVHRIPVFPRGKNKKELIINYISFVFFSTLFAPWIFRKKKIDLIFVFAPSPIIQAIPAIFLKRIKKIPLLLWVQDLWPESVTATGYISNKFVLKGIEFLVRWIYKNSNVLLIQSKAFRAKIKNFSDNKHIIYFPNSFISKDNVNPIELEKINEFNCEFPILFAGNLGHAQSLKTIITAAKKLRNKQNIRFIMMGHGSLRHWMSKEAIQYNLNNIFFLDPLPVNMMPSVMAQAAALLVTLSDTEIFRLTIPSKIQAYLAAGKPILACLNGEGAEIVKEAQAGLVIPAENGESLADAILKLSEMSEETRLSMGNNGKKFYRENFSHEKLVQDLIGYFYKVKSGELL